MWVFQLSAFEINTGYPLLYFWEKWELIFCYCCSVEEEDHIQVFLKKTDCFLHNEWRKPQVWMNIRKLWKIICTNDEPFSNTAWLGQKYEAILRNLGFSRTSWQIVRVGTSMHIHALNFQEWCKKSVLMLLDRQGHSGKGLMLVSFCRLSNREVSGKESQLRKWSH